MRQQHFSILVGITLGVAGLGFPMLATSSDSSNQPVVIGTPPGVEPRAEIHESHVDPGVAFQLPSRSESFAVEAVSSAPPTRRSFMATWQGVSGATAYRLDVSTNSAFSGFVGDYHDLDVGNVIGRVVTGLEPGTTYCYRVRPYGAMGTGSYSEVMTATTAPATGLMINATFDSSITNNPNAAAIEAVINRAIALYESLFSDPVTIQIRFRYAITGPDGTPLPHGVAAESLAVVYTIPWNVVINALRADARSNNDSTANASLPASPLSTNIEIKGANGRAIALDTPTAMFANGNVGNGGPYDGIVTLNSSAPFQFTRPTSPNNLDAQRSLEHEVDEVIGLGSHLGHNGNDLWPQDLFSWRSSGVRNISTSGTRYFSIDRGVTNIVDFSQDPNADFGDWQSSSCPQAYPYVQNAFGCTGQSSDIGAASPEGINLDVIGYDLNQVTLSNISARGFVQTGNNVMIGGFIVQGTGPKRVIIRAIGPELSQHGVPNVLANPTLELHNDSGALIGSNDDWQTTIIGGVITGNQVTDIQNSGHAPTAATESAIIADLQPGNYTAIVRGISNTTGVALVEVYDLDSGSTSVLGNISTRGFIQTGDNVMIGGFVVQGTGAKRVILRAIGPELTQHGVPNVLANPTLELHNGSGALIGFNNDWQTTIIGGVITGNQVTDIQNSGHAPTAATESAIIADLQPGNYTAIVRGVNNSTGVALVEVYDLE
jgi:hypothetical protein